jgi:formylglycine-generating enzyme required for sulfatase activity
LGAGGGVLQLVTSRYYGETDELLGKYAWYLLNSKGRTWPVGSKKPNDLGLFDVQGNGYVWCQERYQEYPATNEGAAIEDKEDILEIDGKQNRVLRGGSEFTHASAVRSAQRLGHVPSHHSSDGGIRPARTVLP